MAMAQPEGVDYQQGNSKQGIAIYILTFRNKWGYNWGYYLDLLF
jgi:hypothetical protein